MKNLLLIPLLCALPVSVQANPFAPSGSDTIITCASDLDGSNVVLTRIGASFQGKIETTNVSGAATIFPGVNSLTFMHIEGQNVMTFVVHFDTHAYDLSIRGPHMGNDHGTCGDPIEG
ncbi:hypothetical protein [Halocynthiibacter sp.]|uniref:hypothetical protein n=1 Tax=Halocynthiibacter sp. TaxID=1979210 RepID=UPI003C5BB2F4